MTRRTVIGTTGFVPKREGRLSRCAYAYADTAREDGWMGRLVLQASEKGRELLHLFSFFFFFL